MLLERGFRPFFLAASLSAALGLPVWLCVLALGWSAPWELGTRDWHVHEMIYGYLAAVVAGFLLTAMPNWTGRAPVQGTPLALLVALWLAGRVAMATRAGPEAVVAVVDVAFPLALSALVWREVCAARNWRNIPVCVAITAFALADAGLQHAQISGGDGRLYERLALAGLAVLMMLVGGRITPAFTGNWMQRMGISPAPAAFSNLDRLALALGVAGAALWTVMPGAPVTAVLLAVAGMLHLLRLLRWRGWATCSEPLVLVLHLAYAWLPVWMLLTACSIGWPGQVGASSALHALTAGALGTMPLAVMTRATRGHGGQALEADGISVLLFVLAFSGAAMRVAAAALPFDYVSVLVLSGALWTGAHVLFLFSYGPMLWGRARS